MDDIETVAERARAHFGSLVDEALEVIAWYTPTRINPGKKPTRYDVGGHIVNASRGYQCSCGGIGGRCAHSLACMIMKRAGELSGADTLDMILEEMTAGGQTPVLHLEVDVLYTYDRKVEQTQRIQGYRVEGGRWVRFERWQSRHITVTEALSVLDKHGYRFATKYTGDEWAYGKLSHHWILEPQDETAKKFPNRALATRIGVAES